MSITHSYIIVDDDSFNNTICRVTIKNALGEVNIRSFTEPQECLSFLEQEYSQAVLPTILFLDINMPTLTGWEFLKEYDKFNELVKNQICIYMVSSSVDQRDKDRASENRYVKGFFSKPLGAEAIREVEKDSIITFKNR